MPAMAPSRADMEGLTVTVCKVTENLAYSFTVCHFFCDFHPLCRHPIHWRSRCMASSQLSRSPKAVSRK